jgi:hypothetical protein
VLAKGAHLLRHASRSWRRGPAQSHCHIPVRF